jgi:predicted lipoprotein with Yx(FWY)xxD motif
VLLSLVAVLALTLGACASDAADESVDSEAPSSAPSAPDHPSAAPSQPAGLPGASETATAAGGESAASVTTGDVDQHGTVLTDGTGRTLYVFFEDSAGESACYDACADNWPPLVTESEPVAEGTADQGLLGTTERDDGTTQVTYDDQPLYLYSGDSEPGQANGFGSGNVWYPVTPGGAPMDVADQSEATADGF